MSMIPPPKQLHLLIVCIFSRFGEKGFGESSFGDSDFGESELNPKYSSFIKYPVRTAKNMLFCYYSVQSVCDIN